MSVPPKKTVGRYRQRSRDKAFGGVLTGGGARIRHVARPHWWQVVRMQWEPRIDVTNADISAAKGDWLAARDGDAPQSRVDELLSGYERLVQTQAQQIADDFRSQSPQ